jgi:hypothetical protein
VLLAAGLALALLDLVSPEAPGVLRVPALIAALLLTTDAIGQLERAFAPATPEPLAEEPITPAPASVSTAPPPATGTPPADLRQPGRAYLGPPEAAQQKHEEEVAAVATTRQPVGSLAYGVLILAVWLGLASMASTAATSQLRLLAMFVTVLVFKRAWDVVGPLRS